MNSDQKGKHDWLILLLNMKKPFPMRMAAENYRFSVNNFKLTDTLQLGVMVKPFFCVAAVVRFE